MRDPPGEGPGRRGAPSGYLQGMAKSARDYDRDYTDPELRERLKEEIKKSDRGGKPGQWSARKSQLLTREYEKAGGGYEHSGERASQQEDLQRWTSQDWQTASGATRARHDGRTERYLPRAAWEEMTPQQRRETNETKQDASARGEQHVPNPEAARTARAEAELDSLNADEAIRRARRMSGSQAADALRHERENKARRTVLRQLERVAGRSGAPDG